MPFQVSQGSLVVIARTANEAVQVFDRLNKAPADGPVVVRELGGRRVKIEDLRAAPPADCQV